MARLTNTTLSAAAGLVLLVATPALSLDVSTQGGAALETLGDLPLAAEEIGVTAGNFRTHLLTLPAGASATVDAGTGEVAVIFVEHGAVNANGAELYAGQLLTIEGDNTATLTAEADARLLIADVVGVSAP